MVKEERRDLEESVLRFLQQVNPGTRHVDGGKMLFYTVGNTRHSLRPESGCLSILG